MSASANSNTTSTFIALSGKNTRKIILIHEITLAALATILLRCGSHILLLILGEDELCAPATFAAAALPLPVGTACHRLGDAIHIAPVVPLHVLLQVHRKLAVCGGGARHTSQSVLATARAELFVHVLGGEETGVAALDECLQMLHSLESSR